MKKSSLISLKGLKPFIILIILSSIFMKYNKHPDWADFIIVFLAPLATIYIGLLVYNYTTNNHSRTLLNSLDEKSGWRKSLFELAGKENICITDIHKLRATLRFDKHDYPDRKFKYMTNIMIKYCDSITEHKDEAFLINEIFIKDQVSNRDICLKTKFNPEIIRLFARFLLVDHWERYQYTEDEYAKIMDKQEFKLDDYYCHPYKKNDKLKDKLLVKEDEYFIKTLNRFVEISNNITKNDNIVLYKEHFLIEDNNPLANKIKECNNYNDEKNFCTVCKMMINKNPV